MTRISPQTFTGATTGAFVPVETHAALARAGIPTVTLDEVVGPEGRLDQAEARELFAKLRRREDGGANRTLDRASPQGRAAEELMDAIRTARAEVAPLRGVRAPAAPVAPRVPSEAVLATYREDAREMRRLLTTMREDVVPSAHDPLLDVLLGGDLALRTVDLLEVGQVPVGHAAGHAIGASVRAVAMTEGILMGGSAIVATLAVLAEIGHANAEGRVEGERLAAIDAYAAGVGAGLDPAGATGRPSDPTHAALYDRGLAEVAGLSPAERIDLEDHLVLWANAATDPHFDDRRKHATLWAVLPDYDAATYATGLASLVGMGRWDPQN